MNQELNRIKQAVFSHLPSIKEVHKQLRLVEDRIAASELSADERLMYDIFRKLEDSIDEVVYNLEYLNTTVYVEGILQKNRTGRYQIGSYEFTSGSPIEVFVYDDFYEVDRWIKTRVEHDGEDYYLYDKSLSKLPMLGLKARVRR